MPAPLAIPAAVMVGGLLLKAFSDYGSAKKTSDFQDRQVEKEKKDMEARRKHEEQQARKSAIERAMTGPRTGGVAFSRYTPAPYSDPLKPPDLSTNALLGGIGGVLAHVGGRKLG
jgi:hypothetical protein